MTPLTYTFLQDRGFKMLIPIVSQNKSPNDEAMTMWGKELDNRIIRLEYHKTSIENNDSSTTDGAKEETPFYPEGVELYMGEKDALEQQYIATINYIEELEPYLSNNV